MKLLSSNHIARKQGLSLFLFFFICIHSFVVAQEPSNHKSTKIDLEAIDTAQLVLPDFYVKLQEKSQTRGGWTKRLYSSLVKNPVMLNYANTERIDKLFLPFKGRHIRKIHIKVIDPFGSNIGGRDSSEYDLGFERFVNKIHVNTKERIILRQLQFKEGQEVSPPLIAETEAHLRAASYIRDARIEIVELPHSEEVDIFVFVQDFISVGGSLGKISTKALDIGLYDKNFMGWGNELHAELYYESSKARKWGYGISYGQRNLWSSFIDFDGRYIDNIDKKNLNLVFERPLKASIRTFGRVEYNFTGSRNDIIVWDSISPDSEHSFSFSLGHALSLPLSYSSTRTSWGFSFFHDSPLYKDKRPADKLYPYQNIQSNLFLGQISIYQQSYYRDFMIRSFGQAENIAHGFNVSSQLGYHYFKKKKKEFTLLYMQPGVIALVWEIIILKMPLRLI